MKKTGSGRVLWVLLFAALLGSCTDDIADDAHYKPRKTNGSVYETLQKEGHYSIFLHGIDLSGYKPIVEGKSIVTVMAPDDDAFATFLQQKGVASIDELYQKDPAYLKQLITYHLMYYSYDWTKMVDFRPTEGDRKDPTAIHTDAGYYYKHRTYCADPIEKARVKLTSNATSDTLISIYHYDRYLPVFSNKLFESKGIDPQYNYTYFYPTSTWVNNTGSAEGFFNVSNGNIAAQGNMITDNGYVYHVDQVIEPLKTIYQELKDNNNYSDFLSLYDQYSTYEQADNQTNQALGYIAYVHKHGSLPAIACEWPVTNNLQVSTLDKTGYNLFVPSNTAMDNFFNSYWTAEGGYRSLKDLDPVILYYFIMQSFSQDNFIVFPEEIKKGDVLTVFGSPVNVNPDEVTYRKMCNNGTLYGMDHMEAPAIFASVLAPAFRNMDHLDYLYALDGSSVVLSLASDKSTFVTLMPTNSQIENSDPQKRLYTTTSGKELQEYSTDAGDFVNMSKNSMLSIVNMHTAANVSSLPESGTTAVATNVAFNYWYVHDGGITTNALFNQQLNPEYSGTPFVKFHNAGKWSNGTSYTYDSPSLFTAVSGDGLAHVLAVGNDKNYQYYLFSQLLKKAGLTQTDSKKGATLSTSILATDATRFMCFAPTNEAIKKHIKEMPGCASLSVGADGTIKGVVAGTNKTKLAAYLRSYFITSDMNSFTTYPYPGSSAKGQFYTTGNYKMDIHDNGSSLSVSFTNATKNNTVEVSPKYYYLPFAFNDGCLHFIDGILL